ncbi:MAG: phosphotyrosine protein phosphatase [Candidatus Marinimicrobia bacterium]|nr:phosphotyrosine protein phosphatase [Candidatus Neomarinimicrobiota bacterium]MCF7881448.1 phosphotyrosine protein phosphatase [Candidatus Neomarinimicrobiota bacterium]
MQRSPTGAALFRDMGYSTDYVGMIATGQDAVTPEKLRWADQVFVMEERHRQFLKQQFPDIYPDLKVHMLGIPDIYLRDDPELKSLLKEKVEPYLD